MKIADLHCDTLSKLYFDRRLSLRENACHVDCKKLQQGGYVLQNFAAFMDRRGGGLFAMCKSMLDIFDRELQANGAILARAESFGDIQKNMEAGKISAILTVEDGAAIEGDLTRLSYLRGRGVRMMNLTWNFRNELASPNQNDGDDGDTREEGLTPLGIEGLSEMERLGIIADVSHLSDAGFWDLCRLARRPFIASHSCARALCDHRRNLSDEMLRAIAERGGIVGLNFYAPFLGVPRSTYAAAAAHIRHIIQVAGEDCIALGSDFDGIDDAGMFGDAGQMQAFPDALIKSGLSPRQVEKIMAQNIFRFYAENL